jgi:hypothetical protein
MLRDWYFLSTILPDLLRSGENYRMKERKGIIDALIYVVKEMYD